MLREFVKLTELRGSIGLIGPGRAGLNGLATHGTSPDPNHMSATARGGQPADHAGEQIPYQSRFAPGFPLPKLGGRRQAVTTLATAVTRKS